MTERKQSLIVNISLSGPERDYDHSVEFLGGSFRIIRMGTGGNVKRAIEELHTWSGQAAAIGISGVHDAEVAGTLKGDPGKLRKAAEESAETVVTDGHRLRNVLQEWTIRHLAGEMPGYFSNARVVVLGGRNHYRTTRVLSESTQNMHFADPAVEYGLSDIHTPFEVFERVVSASGWLLEKLPSRGGLGCHRPGPCHRDPRFAAEALQNCTTSWWPPSRNSPSSSWTTSRARPSSRRPSDPSQEAEQPAGAWSRPHPRRCSAAVRRCGGQ